MADSQSPIEGSDLRRVLVVEDDDLVSEIVVALLEDHYEAVVAASVDAALAELDRVRPAVILLDCQLPGGRVTDVLQAADAHAIPVALVSGDPAHAARIDPTRPFLSKPFSQDTLLQILHRISG